MHYRLLKKWRFFYNAALLLGILTLAGCNGSLPAISKNATPAISLTKMPEPGTSPEPAVSPDITLNPDKTSTPSITPRKDITSPVDSTPAPGISEALTPTQALSAVPKPTVTPTPDIPFSPTPAPTGTIGDVSFSETGYFFSEPISVALSLRSDKYGYITYTMDGSEPTKDSALYMEPLSLPAGSERFPNAYSIRARAWFEDGTSSAVYVHTYFVGRNIEGRYTTVLFSINGDPAALTDGPDGILYGENYKQRGAASEREVHIEAILPDQTLLFSQLAGVRVFGGTSREHPVKSLKLYARKKYEEGKGSFAANLFGTLMADGVTPVQKYDKLVLRNGGDDFQLSFLRDELLHRLAPLAGFSDYEAVIPAVGYVNGSYYGFYWLHESYCNKYFQNKYGKKDGTYIVLEGSERKKNDGNDEAEAAAAAEYNELYKKYAFADLTDDKLYHKLCTLIDVENYLDYMAYNMYAANYDWPHGNYKVYRYYANDADGYGDAPADGRWRFLLHDMDIGLGTYQSTADAGALRNDLKEVLGDTSGKRYAPLLAHLVKRTDCRDYFIRKMLEYMNGALSYESIDTCLLQMCGERDTELMYYFEYLQNLENPSETIYAGTKSLNRHLDRIRTFAKLRPDYMRGYLEDFFKISIEDYLTDTAGP